MKTEFFTLCPLCQGREFSLRYDLSNLKVFQCRACSLVFLNPYNPPSEMSAFYQNHEARVQANSRLASYYSYLGGSRTEKFFDETLVRLKPYLSGDRAALLDIACGNGHFLSRAKQKGWEVRGLDSSAENSRSAWENHQITVAVSDFGGYRTNERFDCVSLWDFIEHVPDPRALLAKAGSFLKPSGVLLVATPDHFSLINFLADLIHLLSFGLIKKPLQVLFVPEHILYFTDRTLKKMLEENGFEIIRVIKTGTDIDRYQTSPLFNWTARILLLMSALFHWQNRIVVFARKRNSN